MDLLLISESFLCSWMRSRAFNFLRCCTRVSLSRKSVVSFRTEVIVIMIVCYQGAQLIRCLACFVKSP